MPVVDVHVCAANGGGLNLDENVSEARLRRRPVGVDGAGTTTLLDNTVHLLIQVALLNLRRRSVNSNCKTLYIVLSSLFNPWCKSPAFREKRSLTHSGTSLRSLTSKNFSGGSGLSRLPPGPMPRLTARTCWFSVPTIT